MNPTRLAVTLLAAAAVHAAASTAAAQEPDAIHGESSTRAAQERPPSAVFERSDGADRIVITVDPPGSATGNWRAVVRRVGPYGNRETRYTLAAALHETRNRRYGDRIVLIPIGGPEDRWTIGPEPGDPAGKTVLSALAGGRVAWTAAETGGADAAAR